MRRANFLRKNFRQDIACGKMHSGKNNPRDFGSNPDVLSFILFLNRKGKVIDAEKLKIMSHLTASYDL